MTSPTLSPTAPKVNAKRFVAPGRSSTRASTTTATGLTWQPAPPTTWPMAGCSARANGERFGWMRSPDARGADAYWRG